ncbi:MAG TPA: universal stress protein [Gallionella sp.]|nr:universal stress protein [Gallionella sp.]HUW76279.1 universal stress protein [Gallionella sp.]
MTYKTILVHIDAGKQCASRIGIAIRLAQQFDASLIGLNALSRIDLPGYVLEGVGGLSIEEFRKRYVDEQVKNGKTTFSKALAASGFAKSEWRTSDLDAVDAVTMHGRYADLIVIGQPWAADNSAVNNSFANQVMLEAGRPVLMIPHSGNFSTIGKRIIVGWNASREATRAVTDAIPFLQQAEVVQVMVINPKAGEHGAMPGNDIALFLARHGVEVEVHVDKASEIDIGNEMLSRASDFGADMIVMGGYGHSRFRESLMGGATRTLIDSMTVPVLLSH